MAVHLDPRISAFPALHGRAVFAMELRGLFWREKFAGVVLALPACLQQACLQAAAHLPVIHAVTLRHPDGTRAFLPMDPCDAYVEALRQALQRRLPVRLLEDETLVRHPLEYTLPDPFLVRGIGPGDYFHLARTFLPDPPGPTAAARAQRVYRGLLSFQKERPGQLLLVCDFPLLQALLPLFQKGSVENVLAESAREAAAGEEEEAFIVGTHPVMPGLLYFALGEPPFYAGELERERQDVLAAPREYLDLVKKLFVETRAHYLGPGERPDISLKKVQAALTYARNLAALEGRLTPDLLDLVTAAKGVFGPSFAAKLFEAARHYPFFDLLSPGEGLEVGIGRIREPGDAAPEPAINLLQDQTKAWKPLRLGREPPKQRQMRYRYAWDARGMCSHVPEDVRIEAFNRTVRRRSRDVLEQARARSERLTSSLKDGIDLRETLRHPARREIHVKEIPPSRGRVDTVVILFDEDNDARYPHRATWYAEHPGESTLTFYATDPMAKMLGPGIAEAEYGGLSLLYPPRPVREIFRMRDTGDLRNLAERLLYGAIINSDEKAVALVSSRRPDLRKKALAARFRKRIVWVPLTSFSQETLRRLRRFHILNGKDVRAWANRYISE